MILDKIYCPEEQRERADKALRLNGFTGSLLPKTRAKPTVRINQLVSDSKLKGASGHGYGTNQSYQEHLASCELCRRVVQMEKANKGLRLLTGL